MARPPLVTRFGVKPRFLSRTDARWTLSFFTLRIDIDAEEELSLNWLRIVCSVELPGHPPSGPRLGSSLRRLATRSGIGSQVVLAATDGQEMMRWASSFDVRDFRTPLQGGPVDLFCNAFGIFDRRQVAMRRLLILEKINLRRSTLSDQIAVMDCFGFTGDSSQRVPFCEHGNGKSRFVERFQTCSASTMKRASRG